MILNQRRSYEISVKGLCQDENGNILVIRDDDGRWELPGGGLELEEDIRECLRRECVEELGVECEVLDHEPYKVWVGQTEKGTHRLILLFRIKLKSFEIKKTSEATEWQFADKQKLDTINLVPQLNKLKEIV